MDLAAQLSITPTPSKSFKKDNLEKMTRGKAIHQKCLDCSENTTALRCCPVLNCPLWQYRFGRSLQGGYKAYLDRDFFETHIDMEQAEFNRLLLAEAHQRGKDGTLKYEIS